MTVEALKVLFLDKKTERERKLILILELCAENLDSLIAMPCKRQNP